MRSLGEPTCNQALTMITSNAFTRGKNLIKTILQNLPQLKISRQQFIVEILMMFLSFRGRINFEQMGRQGERCEKTYRLHFEKEFDWLEFNKQFIEQTCTKELIIGFDPSYISKSGKHTPGLGKFYSGVNGGYKKGLEIGNLAIIDVKQNTAYHLESITSPAMNSRAVDDGSSIVDHYANIIIERKDELIKLSNVLVVDGYFAKKKYISKIMNDTEFEIICRLRDDANLRYLYKGKTEKKRGRPKKYAGKIDVKKIDKRRVNLVLENENYRIYEQIVWSVGLEMEIKLCYVEILTNNGEVRTIKLFFSTNLNRSAIDILKYYKARFQMEYLFRDGKQYTGLEHCQARSKNKLNFHFNASLSAINIAKGILRKGIPKSASIPYSIGDLSIRLQNRNMLNRILSNYGFDHKLIKITKTLNDILNYGIIAA